MHAGPPLGANSKGASMHQIVYTSTATESFSSADLRKLLLGARKRNRAFGVSGMLVFHDGTFLQALEGEHRAVDEIFASISSDQRHGDIDVLHRGRGIDQRVFGDWSMGFIADFTGAADILKGFIRLNNQLRGRERDGSHAVELSAKNAIGEEHESAEA